MEELQLIIQMVTGLPTLTIWVLLGYLVYKLAIVGSTYGVIRYALDTLIKWKTAPLTYTYVLEDEMKLISKDIGPRIMDQLKRIQDNSWGYFYGSDVDKLKKAIDMVIKKEV